MFEARFRLAGLWISQTARVLADNCLRMVVVLAVAHTGLRAQEEAWYQVTPFFILPFLLFAPLNGALSNSWPKRLVLNGAAAWCLVGAGLVLFLVGKADSWTSAVALGVMMVGSAVYSAARYALLPAVARDSGIPLPRVTGWVEAGGGAGVVLGLMLGTQLTELATICAFVLGLNVLALMTVSSASFPSDVCRREPAGAAVAGFFRDGRRIWRNRKARASLLGLAAFLALVTGSVGALLATTGALDQRDALAGAMLFVGVGTAIGSFVASWQGHPRRTLGLVPYGATGMLLALAWSGIRGDLKGPSLALGFMAGLVNVPLRASYQRLVPADARGNAMAVSNGVNYLFTIGLLGLLLGLSHLGLLAPTGQLWFLMALAMLGAVAAWALLFRESFEQLLEIVFWACYRVYGHGPGLGELPTEGPLLVVCNHTAWFDPLFISKVIPRRMFPMMTSEFYDVPGVRWIFRHIFEAIRVQASAFRREAPEIQDAIRHLDRGHAVSLWPEGWLRRKPEPTLRQFGRGVWHILRERPKTPVVLCWVEGGYGSFTSYYQGRPTKNKRPDFWRRIDVAVAAPRVIPPDILADHRATRTYLMRECLKARGLLGLEIPPLPERDELGEEKEEAGPSE